MIYVDIDDIRMPFRRALAEETAITTYTDHVDLMKQLGRANNCRIVGTEFKVTDPTTLLVKRSWTTDGIEFPSEEAYAWFMLRWA